jgi:hypothetical protein
VATRLEKDREGSRRGSHDGRGVLTFLKAQAVRGVPIYGERRHLQEIALIKVSREARRWSCSARRQASPPCPQVCAQALTRLESS